MNWRTLFQSFPKYAIALAVVIVSTGIFGLWWVMRGSPAKPQASKPAQGRTEKAAVLPQKLDHLALVGPDLYDIQSGELLFRNWLRGTPQRVFYHPGGNHILVQAERGIMRFGLDGKPDGVMAVESPPAFTNDGSLAMYIRDGDIWLAEPDWAAFKFTHERQVTRYGQFYAPFFSANVPLASEKACLVNHQNQLLRVDFTTGDLQQVGLPLDLNMRLRSPDCKMLVGVHEQNFYVYDIDQTEPKLLPRGDGNITDMRWLDNDTSVFLVEGVNLGKYIRSQNKLEEVVSLPFKCRGISSPSLGGRYVLCAGNNGYALVDMKERKAEPLDIKVDHMQWVSDDTLIYSREVPDMKLRGTWIKKVGREPVRVYEQPYVVGYDGTVPVAVMEELQDVVFATRNALIRMKSDGSGPQEIAKLSYSAGRIQAVKMWGGK